MERKRASPESSESVEPLPKRQAKGKKFTDESENEDPKGPKSTVTSQVDEPVVDSPYRKMVKRLEAVLNQQNAKEYMLVRGCKGEDEEEEEDENENEKEDEKNDKLTEEEISKVRFVVLTNRRHQFMHKMLRKVLGKQYGDSFLMFNTSFSYHIFDLIPKQLKAVGRQKSFGEKFDLMFALTYSVSRYDTWIHDNEDRSEVKRLADQMMKKWKSILIKSNEELEIDGEFTRPGVIAMIEEFIETLEEVDITIPVPSFA